MAHAHLEPNVAKDALLMPPIVLHMAGGVRKGGSSGAVLSAFLDATTPNFKLGYGTV